jgi:hypothetical protein
METTFPRRSLLDFTEEALTPFGSSGMKQSPGRSPGFSDLRYTFPPVELGSGKSYQKFPASRRTGITVAGQLSTFRDRSPQSTKFPFHPVPCWNGPGHQIDYGKERLLLFKDRQLVNDCQVNSLAAHQYPTGAPSRRGSAAPKRRCVTESICTACTPPK